MKNKYKMKAKFECSRCNTAVMKKNIHHYGGEFGLNAVCKNCFNKNLKDLEKSGIEFSSYTYNEK